MATTYLKFDPRLFAFMILFTGLMIVDDQPQIGETTYGPIFARSSNCPHGLRRADRNGQGMIGELGMKHGIGPCNDLDCECWQCPYNTPFSLFGPGEYAGPARIQRIAEYRLWSGDTVEFTFSSVGYKTDGAYRLVVGDELLIESEADEEVTRGTLEHGLMIQPDGTITLRLIGQIHAAGQSVEQLRKVLNQKYTEFFDEPDVDVTPVRTGTAARYVRGASLVREAHQADEIWLRDGDVIVLPSTPIRLINNLVRQVLTAGVYGVVPFNASYNFSMPHTTLATVLTTSVPV